MWCFACGWWIYGMSVGMEATEKKRMIRFAFFSERVPAIITSFLTIVVAHHNRTPHQPPLLASNTPKRGMKIIQSEASGVMAVGMEIQCYTAYDH